MAEVAKVVGEVLPPREMLAEVREAAAERMASGIDDLGVRQDQLDEWDEQPVVRQLVDEERTVRPALDGGALQIFLAESAPLFL